MIPKIAQCSVPAGMSECGAKYEEKWDIYLMTVFRNISTHTTPPWLLQNTPVPLVTTSLGKKSSTPTGK